MVTTAKKRKAVKTKTKKREILRKRKIKKTKPN